MGITIGTDSKMNLLGVSVLLEGDVGAEDGICGGHLDVRDLGVEAGGALQNGTDVAKFVHIYLL